MQVYRALAPSSFSVTTTGSPGLEELAVPAEVVEVVLRGVDGRVGASSLPNGPLVLPTFFSDGQGRLVVLDARGARPSPRPERVSSGTGTMSPKDKTPRSFLALIRTFPSPLAWSTRNMNSGRVASTIESGGM